jgi:hypothetical protein
MFATLGFLVPGCTVYPDIPAESLTDGRQVTFPGEPHHDPSHDHFIARIPRGLAATSTEARAMTHVAIGRARARGGSEQCGSTWLGSGPVSGSSGPYLTDTAAGRAWYYRVSYKPGLAGCGESSLESRYQALQQALPEWISLQRAADTWPDRGSRQVRKAER